MLDIDINACRLAKKTKIKLRLEKMRQAAKSSLIADEIERKEILSEISRGKLSQFTDENGVIDRRKLDSSAIQGVDEQTTMGKMASIIKLRLHNPIQAIDLLNKMDKLYTDGASVNIDNRTWAINVNSEKAKELTERIIEGERTSGYNGHQDI